jgi:predicted LPLAT superfamily acyltransferase
LSAKIETKNNDAGPDHWAEMTELGSAWGLGFLYFVYRRLGRWPFRLALAPVLVYFLVFAGAQRKASREFLSRAGVPGPLPLAVARHFWSFAEAVLDKLVAWKGGIRAEDVSYEGRDPVQAVLSQGRGLLMIGSHLGNLEVCRVMARLRPGLVVHILVHTRHAENFNRLLKRLDPTGGVNLVQVSDFGAGQAAWLSERIGMGEVVLIAGDRRPLDQGRTLAAEFLGAEAPFSLGPFALAAALGCPVFLIFCLKQNGRFRIIYEPFSETVLLPRARRREALAELAQRYALRLQHHCLQAPYQWFNFYPFWS